MAGTDMRYINFVSCSLCGTKDREIAALKERVRELERAYDGTKDTLMRQVTALENQLSTARTDRDAARADLARFAPVRVALDGKHDGLICLRRGSKGEHWTLHLIERMTFGPTPEAACAAHPLVKAKMEEGDGR